MGIPFLIFVSIFVFFWSLCESQPNYCVPTNNTCWPTTSISIIHSCNIQRRRHSTKHIICKSTITVDTGLQWGEIYPIVDKIDKLIVGGGDPTVGPGGYSMGGGHSLDSAKQPLENGNVVCYGTITVSFFSFFLVFFFCFFVLCFFFILICYYYC